MRVVLEIVKFVAGFILAFGRVLGRTLILAALTRAR